MGCCCCCSPIFCACYSTLIQVAESIVVSVFALMSYKCQFGWLKPPTSVGSAFIWNLYYEDFYSKGNCVVKGRLWAHTTPEFDENFSLTSSKQTYAWFCAFLANACLWGTSAILLFIFRKTKWAHKFYITCSYITLVFDLLLFSVFLAEIKRPIDIINANGVAAGLTELFRVLILPLYFIRGFFGWFSNIMTTRRITAHMRGLKPNKVHNGVEAPPSETQMVGHDSSDLFPENRAPVAFQNNALMTTDENPPPSLVSSDRTDDEARNRSYPQYSREPRNFEVSASSHMGNVISLPSAPKETDVRDDRTIDRIPYESMEPYMPLNEPASRSTRYGDERQWEFDRGNKEKDFDVRQLNQSPRTGRHTSAATATKAKSGQVSSSSSLVRDERPWAFGDNPSNQSRKPHEAPTPREPVPDYDKRKDDGEKAYQEPETLKDYAGPKSPKRSSSDVYDHGPQLLTRPRRLSAASDVSEGKTELRNQLPWSYVRPNDLLASSSRINAAKHRNEVLRNQPKSSSSVVEEFEDDEVPRRECEYASIQHLPTDDNYLIRKFLSENNIAEAESEVIYESLDNILRRKESIKRKSVLKATNRRRSSSYLETALDDNHDTQIPLLSHKPHQTVRLPLYENLPQPKKLSSSVKDVRGRSSPSSISSPATRLKHNKSLLKKKNEGEGLGQLCTDEFEIESFISSPLALQPARVTPDSPRKANKNQRVRFSLYVEKALQEKEAAQSLFKCHYTTSNQLIHLPPCNGHICTYIVSDDTESSV